MSDQNDKKFNLIFEEKKLKSQKALEQVANPKCSKCHGTGNLGWNRTHTYWITCRCVLKKISTYQNFKKEQESITLIKR